jgi:hypothetical protein
MKLIFKGILITFVLLQLLGLGSCKHEPFFDDGEITPIDTTGNPIDTTGNPVDTTIIDTTGIPCDPDIVYFNRDVLPILRSNCAFSGCHDAPTSQDGVNLETYETVMATADVEPFDLNESKIYRVLIEDDPDDKMPPAPNAPLSQEQVSMIAKWILQGAMNLECDENSGGCNTTSVSFSADIQPVIQNNCVGCHSGGAPSGGIKLVTYADVKQVVNNGKLFGAVSWQQGFVNMPFGGDQLPQCTIDQIEAWIADGALEN